MRKSASLAAVTVAWAAVYSVAVLSTHVHLLFHRFNGMFRNLRRMKTMRAVQISLFQRHVYDRNFTEIVHRLTAFPEEALIEYSPGERFMLPL